MSSAFAGLFFSLGKFLSWSEGRQRKRNCWRSEVEEYLSWNVASFHETIWLILLEIHAYEMYASPLSITWSILFQKFNSFMSCSIFLYDGNYSFRGISIFCRSDNPKRWKWTKRKPRDEVEITNIQLNFFHFIRNCIPNLSDHNWPRLMHDELLASVVPRSSDEELLFINGFTIFLPFSKMGKDSTQRSLQSASLYSTVFQKQFSTFPLFNSRQRQQDNLRINKFKDFPFFAAVLFRGCGSVPSATPRRSLLILKD